MELRKKSMFFTIDSIVAATIIFAVIVFASSVYIKGELTPQVNFVSSDLVKVMSTLTVV